MGAYELTGEWFRSTRPTWADEVEQGKIIYPWQVKLKLIQLGTASVKELAPRLSFIENKERWSVYLRGAIANMGRPIGSEDYQLILEELQKPPIQVSTKPILVATAFRKEAIVTPKPTVSVTPQPSVPSHKELIEMLHQIGETFGFAVKTEEYTPDQAYRCDVTWRDYEAHSPIKVFEVEVSGNVDHALSSLAHACDMWRPERLYLIISDEGDLDRARRLVEPRIRGAFSRIRGKLKVHVAGDIKRLHDNLAPHKDLVKDLAQK